MENLKNYFYSQQITNEDLFLEYKETYLILQRALLRAKLFAEVKSTGEIYEKIKSTLLETSKTE